MVNQDTIICETCGTSYAPTSPHCPDCGEANPFVTEDLLAASLELDPPSRRQRMRGRSGCLIIFLFLLFFSLVVGGIIWGGYEGLQDRAVRTQVEVEKHYEQALIHLENDRLALAKAELELTLSLDPTHSQARETLAQLVSTPIAKTTPTPTITSEIEITTQPSALLEEVKTQTQQGNWAEAIEILKYIREIAPGYEANEISERLYNANYELGLRYISEEQLAEAVIAFDEALVERPNDPVVTAEWEKVTLYLSLKPADPANFEDNIVVLSRIYTQDPDFADVAERLYDNYKQWGDYLGGQDQWCSALSRYEEAAAISSNVSIESLIAGAGTECDNSRRAIPSPTATPTVRRSTPTPTIRRATATATPTPTPDTPPGTIYFSRFNRSRNLWEIISFDLRNETEQVILSNAIHPDVNSNGNLLVYHSEVSNSFGLHVLNLTTGADIRVTAFAEDILPHWNRNSRDFVFTSQRAGDRRWQIFIGFADGKGDAVALLDGRTPTSSHLNNLIAYQGTDPQGNQPGIYTVSRQEGAPERITTHESDRNPAFSPINNQIAFMSVRSGSWDIWTVPANGGLAQRLTTSPTNDGLPTWSPDGTHIAFVSDRDGDWGVYILNLSNGERQKIANWGGNRQDWLLDQLSWGP